MSILRLAPSADRGPADIDDRGLDVLFLQNVFNPLDVFSSNIMCSSLSKRVGFNSEGI